GREARPDAADFGQGEQAQPVPTDRSAVLGRDPPIALALEEVRRVAAQLPRSTEKERAETVRTSGTTATFGDEVQRLVWRLAQREKARIVELALGIAVVAAGRCRFESRAESFARFAVEVVPQVREIRSADHGQGASIPRRRVFA